MRRPDMPLDGIRVVDAATVVAGPGLAARLGDFGADVIKIEHPRVPDSTRAFGWEVNGITLWSKWIGRNKRPITLNLSHPEGTSVLLRLVRDADVLVESFRPGTLERWGVGPDRLLEANPGLVVARVSGFGQTGPYRERAGFGTLAESMSGYAHMTGFPDGPPVLPPIALADEVAALTGAFAVMVALYRRDARSPGPAAGRGVGGGQVIDVSLVESLTHITGPVAAAHDRLGVVPGRIGNRIAYAAPRGAYRTRDDRWLGISGSSDATARRVFEAIGHPELAGDVRFATNQARVANRELLDGLIAGWVAAHTLEQAMTAFLRHEAPAAPIYDIEQIVADPQVRERASLVRVADDELGDVLLPDVQPRLSGTPGAIRHAGKAAGAATEEVLTALGLSPDDIRRLRAGGAV